METNDEWFIYQRDWNTLFVIHSYYLLCMFDILIGLKKASENSHWYYKLIKQRQGNIVYWKIEIKRKP